MNVVREMAHRGQRADAEGLHHRRHRAERLRHRARPGSTRRSPITTGLLEKLDREELQGVIGHELSHVRNFDIRFSLIVGVMVGAIAILADFFLRFTFWGGGAPVASDRDGGGGGAQAIIFVIAIVLAILAPIISRFIQLAVSRQREYLADASSVELTRNPVGLERALAKISSDQEVLEVANRGDAAHVLHEPDQEVRGALVGADVDAPRDPRPDQPAARADGRAAAPARRPRTSPTWSRERRGPRSTGALACGATVRLAAAGADRDCQATAGAAAHTGAGNATVRRQVERGERPRGPRGRAVGPVGGAAWQCRGLRAVVSCHPPTGSRRLVGHRAEIAQLVEHATENRGVASSILALGTTYRGGRIFERKWLSW